MVFALLGAGVICAFQVGKAAIAVPLVRHDLNLSLSFASWLVSAYAALGALAGLAIGIGVTRVSPRAVAIGGMALLGVASCLGATATSGEWLLVTRVIEGFGFIPAVIAMPSLIRAVSAQRDDDVVMSIWSSYVPIGMVIIMLAGPWVAAGGWRLLWLGNGVLAILYAGVLALVAPRVPVRSQSGSRRSALDNARDVLRLRGPVLLALSFCLYTIHYHALVGLMPTLMIDRLGLSITTAGALVALTIFFNAVGNLSAGWLNRIGIPPWMLLAIAFVLMATMSLGIFSPYAPAALVAALACISIGFSGVVPGSVFVCAPAYTPRPELLSVTLGVIVQASTIGQFLGPAALGGWADNFGWSSAPIMFVILGAVGLMLSLGLRGAKTVAQQ
ncbi:MAG TPA: MFS transporter [Pseudolabrys sp.]